MTTTPPITIEPSGSGNQNPTQEEFTADRSRSLGLEIFDPLSIPLEPVSGPIAPSLRIDSKVSASLTELLSFPTTLDTTTFNGDRSMHIRRAEAMSLGADYLFRHYYNPDIECLSRASKKKFRLEVNLLEQAIKASAIKFADSDVYGYQPSSNYYPLIDRLRELYNMFVQASVDPPLPLPVWGRDEKDNLRFWNSTDYEILSICFRYDVERFLATVNPFFNGRLEFKKPPQSKDKGKDVQRDKPPHMEQAIESVPETTVATEKGPINTNIGVSVLDAGLSSVRQRQASLFGSRPSPLNLGYSMFQRPSNQIQEEPCLKCLRTSLISLHHPDPILR